MVGRTVRRAIVVSSSELMRRKTQQYVRVEGLADGRQASCFLWPVLEERNRTPMELRGVGLVGGGCRLIRRLTGINPSLSPRADE